MPPAGKRGIVCVSVGGGQRVCFRPGLCGTCGYRVGVGVNSQSDSLAAQGLPSSGQAGYRPLPSPTPQFLCAGRKILEHPSPYPLGAGGKLTLHHGPFLPQGLHPSVDLAFAQAW